MKYSQVLSYLLVPLALLTGCGLPLAVNPGSGGPVFQVQSDEILPGSKGDRNGILPGSKGDRNGILPGSKGERNQLAALMVQVELPAADAAFVTLALECPELSSWVASVDGQTVPTRLIGVRNEAGSQVASFELNEVPIGSGVQELLFKSLDGNVRAAALLPALQAEQRELAAPLTPLSMAVWQLLKSEQASQGAEYQHLNPASIEAEAETAEAQSLATELEAEEQARIKGRDAKATQEKNSNAGPNTGKGQDQNTESGQNQGSKSAQGEAPEADPVTDQDADQDLDTDAGNIDEDDEPLEDQSDSDAADQELDEADSPKSSSPQAKNPKSDSPQGKSGQENTHDAEDGDDSET